MHFWSFVLKNVARRKVRSALTVVGMAIAVGAVVALVGVSRGFERSFLSVYQRQKIDIVVQQAGVRQRLTSVLPENLGDRIQQIPGVKQVNAGLVDFVALEGAGPMGVLVQGWPPDSQQLKDLNLIAGRLLTAQDTRGVLLGKVLARNLNLGIGGKFPVFEGSEPFEVVGIFEGESVYENGMMVMLLSQLQKFMGREGQVSGFSVVLNDPEKPGEIERVVQEIEHLGKNIAATPVREFVQGTSELQVVRAMAWVTSAIALIIGAVGMLNTMIMSVFERTKEIGILRAIGWRKVRVVRMILLESLLLSISGGIVGILVAMAMIRLLSSLPWASGLVASGIPPMVLVEGMIIAVLVGVLGAAYPAWRGAQLDPTEALRHE